MPSFLSKLTGSSKSKSNNPYQSPHHPSHLPVPLKANTQLPFPPPPLCSISPTISSNHLAEARQVANRDPITGRALPSAPDAASAARAQITIANAEQSAYMKRASQMEQTSGSRYDMLSNREKRLREEATRTVKNGERLEFYAPERRIGEFYGGGERD